MKPSPWRSEVRRPRRPAEPLAGVSPDRKCRRKTARRLQEASPVDLGTRNVDISSSASRACERIESGHVCSVSCAVMSQGHSQLRICSTLALLQLPADGCLQDVWCFDILFFKDFQHLLSLSTSPPARSVSRFYSFHFFRARRSKGGGVC